MHMCVGMLGSILLSMQSDILCSIQFCGRILIVIHWISFHDPLMIHNLQFEKKLQSAQQRLEGAGNGGEYCGLRMV